FPTLLMLTLGSTDLIVCSPSTNHCSEAPALPGAPRRTAEVATRRAFDLSILTFICFSFSVLIPGQSHRSGVRRTVCTDYNWQRRVTKLNGYLRRKPQDIRTMGLPRPCRNCKHKWRRDCSGESRPGLPLSSNSQSKILPS